MATVFVSGDFDDLRLTHVRMLQEAARLGPVHVLLWSDAAIQQSQRRRPKFPEAERQYLIEAIRYVDRVTLCDGPIVADALPIEPTNSSYYGVGSPSVWVVAEDDNGRAVREFCRKHSFECHVLPMEQLKEVPADNGSVADGPDGQKRVIVTGCYDWFHSGHVRFFEEVSAFGDLYVVVGHDANIRFLKGEGHPLFPEQQRRYMVQSVRFVKEALVATGDGWLDAEPEIQRLRPHIYAVNEDGDRPEKRDYCRLHGIEYRVLQRQPRQGLSARFSTALRGF